MPTIKQILGPAGMWQASVVVGKPSEPVENFALRTLFAQNPGLSDTSRMPGVSLAVVSVEQVTVRLNETFVWKATKKPPKDALSTVAKLEAALKTGTHAVLLLHTDPKGWSAEPVALCVGGRIALPSTVFEFAAAKKLAAALELSFAPGEGARAVDGSGLVVAGSIDLPWAKEPSAGVFQVSPVWPLLGRTPQYTMALLPERLSPPQSQRFIDELNRLGELLRPQTAPAWTTLEIPRLSSIPQLRWPRIFSGNSSRQLEINPSAFRLLLSDQRPDNKDHSPTSIAQVVLDKVFVRIDDEKNLLIEVQAGQPDATKEVSLIISSELKGDWIETLKVVEGGAEVQPRLVFDPVEVAAQLRCFQSLANPTWLPDFPLEDPTLYGFSPLENGWAQLPFLNATDQIYADLNLAQPPLLEPGTSLLQGAVVFGNRSASNSRDEQNWEMTLTRCRSLGGSWTFKSKDDLKNPFELTAIEVEVAHPTLFFDGLLYLSSDRPGPTNSLPDLDNWVSGLFSVTLRTAVAGLPINLPHLVNSIGDSEPWIATLDKATANNPGPLEELLARIQELNLALESDPSSGERVSQPEVLAKHLRLSRTKKQSNARTDWRLSVQFGEDGEFRETFVFRQQTDQGLKLYTSLGLSLQDELLAALQVGQVFKMSERLQIFFEAHEYQFGDKLQVTTEATDGYTFLDPDQPQFYHRLRLKDGRWEFRRRGADSYPAPCTFVLSDFSATRRGGDKEYLVAVSPWRLTSHIREKVQQKLTLAKLMSPGILAEQRPWAWLRHQTLPLIQSLPLTQSQNPPNYPSPSRQLCPFEVSDADGWSLTWERNVAMTHWPIMAVPSQLKAQAALAEFNDLTLASLSLPGVAFNPDSDIRTDAVAAVASQPWVFRHDLPYLDEVNALATLVNPNDEQTSLGAVEGLPPLTPASYGEHWERLANRAGLAALSAVQAFRSGAGPVSVAYLVEPYHWETNVAPTLGPYPGRLAFTGLNLAGDDALQGLHGSFRLDDSSLSRVGNAGLDGSFRVVAGSLASHLDKDGRLQDQRGLLRQATVQDGVLKTRLQLVGRAAETEPTVHLVTCLSAVELTGADQPWSFWFRDLPVDDKSNKFFRNDEHKDGDPRRSLTRQDVNEPEAISAEHDYKLGYEWRLGLKNQPAEAVDGMEVFPLKLCGFDFYPLACLQLEMDPNRQNVTRLVLCGRLQLPVRGATERADLNNLVRLTFDSQGESLALQTVEGSGEWPLSGDDDAPDVRLRWKLKLNQDLLVMSGLALVHARFGKLWVHSVPTATLPLNGGLQRLHLVGEEKQKPGTDEQLIPARLIKLELDLVGLDHQVLLGLKFDLKRKFTVFEAPAPLSEPVEDPPVFHVVKKGDTLWDIAKKFYGAGNLYPLIFQANRNQIKDPDLIFVGQKLLIPSKEPKPVPPPAPQPKPPKIRERSLLALQFKVNLLKLDADSVLLEGPRFLGSLECLDSKHELRRSALQFRWARVEAREDAQLFAGMRLKPQEVTGYAVVIFDPLEDEALAIRSVAIEALLPCTWGTFLASEDKDLRPEQIHPSSAGDLVAAYFAKFRNTWKESLLFNGSMQVTNLISWPKELMVSDGKLTLPPFGAEHVQIRNCARVLFNQHELTLDQVIAHEPAESSPILLQLNRGFAWEFLGVVEHHLVQVDCKETYSLSHRKRWTALQRITICRPDNFHEDLVAGAVKPAFDPTDPKTPLFASVHQGYVPTHLLPLLKDPLVPEPTFLLVDLSAHFWVGNAPMEAERLQAPTAIQYLPTGTQMAVLSQPEDYTRTEANEGPEWFMLTLPFLGRLLPVAEAFHNQGEPRQLRMDPIQHLQYLLKEKIKPLPKLLLALTNTSDSNPVSFKTSSVDSGVARTVAYLDRASLEESWMRIQNPPREVSAGLASVLASQTDSPGRISREPALRRLTPALRKAYPPLPEVGESLALSNAYFTLSSVASQQTTGSQKPGYAWHIVGMQLSTSALWTTPTSTLHVAATVLPSQTKTLTDWPVSLAVSPYLSLDFQPPPNLNEDDPPHRFARVVSAELLCLDFQRSDLVSVSVHTWEVGNTVDGDGAIRLTYEQIRDASQSWAKAVHQLEASDSPIAVIRYREIHASEDGRKVRTRFDYTFLDGLEVEPRLATMASSLRLAVASMAFRDGQYGGSVVPNGPRSFELAPPQIVGVEPIYQLPTTEEATPAALRDMPWGLSALCIQARYTAGGLGVIGVKAGISPAKLWWQAPQQMVHYRNHLDPVAGRQSRAGLPPSFRAPAIASFLPVVPRPALPLQPFQGLDNPKEARLDWQAVLPGELRYFIIGARPGAILGLRHQLLTQTLVLPVIAGQPTPPAAEYRHSQTMVSGSVPVQHRVPRPVPLPAVDVGRRAVALRTWGSYFEATQSLKVSERPMDETFLAPSEVWRSVGQETLDALAVAKVSATDEQVAQLREIVLIPTKAEFLSRVKAILPAAPEDVVLKNAVRDLRGDARGLRFELAASELDSGWTGVFDVRLTCLREERESNATGKWVIESSLEISGTAYPFNKLEVDEPFSGSMPLQLTEEALKQLSDILGTLAGLAPGTEVRLSAACKLELSDCERLEQKLILPLLVTRPQEPRLPLAPYRIQFEDPEYNRRLSTQAAYITSLIEEKSANDPTKVFTVKLAADRREYNLDSNLFWRYDWEDDREDTPEQILVQRVRKGVLSEAKFSVAVKDAEGKPLVQSGNLQTLSISTMTELKLEPGDVLQLQITVKSVKMRLQLNLVAKPVNPTPEAAYALLRRQAIDGEIQVECTRFAWAPASSRIELICPKDLQSEVVRRRAVFQWLDVTRAAQLKGYALQKIAQNGSTHVIPEETGDGTGSEWTKAERFEGGSAER